jgi:SAM-dependent methyltransferase
MNRKQRRAGAKDRVAPVSGPTVAELVAQAAWLQQTGKADDAARLYERALDLEPEHPQAINGLGCIWIAEGKHAEASQLFARLLRRFVELADDFASVYATLRATSPALAAAIDRAVAWPAFAPIEAPFSQAERAAFAADPLLLEILTSTTVRDADFERFLTLLRHDILRQQAHGHEAPRDELPLHSALAQQCFINEYVFAQSEQEIALLAPLRERLNAALGGGAPVTASLLTAVAMYVPLHSFAGAERLPKRHWPAAVAQLLTQQISEPLQEAQYRSAIPRITAIDDATSELVRQQYEDNPYPRWVRVGSAQNKISINEYVRNHCPTAAFTPVESNGPLDILVAGCGTGRHPIDLAQIIDRARFLAVDLSLTSLCYATRKTPPQSPIDYAQADILNLGSISRTFDVIESVGVLHHMADPLAGWRVLLSLLRPGGLMRVGLYSELARRDIVTAREFIERQGIAPTLDGIRRARMEIMASPLRNVTRFGDFFSTSECRDMLFHVQERRFTLPELKAFFAENNLRFVGFVLPPAVRERYHAQFRAAGAPMSDLNLWHKIESEHPDVFTGMYQFWVQKH